MGLDSSDFGVINVGALMSQVKLHAPTGTVTVQGTVTELRRWSKDQTIVFGTLQGFDKSLMSFKCDYSEDFDIQHNVVLRGTLVAYKAKQHRGFDLLLEGTRIGTWKPSEAAAKLSLERFIVQNATAKIALIGTEIGIEDVRATLDDGVKTRLQPFSVSTGLEEIRAAVKEAATTCDGLCLVRGGGPDTFETWNDSRLVDTLLEFKKRFYTALGHANNVTLVDKYADEAFVAPSDLGNALTIAWSIRGKQEDLRRENQKLKALRADANRTALDSKLLRLQTILDEFQMLPGMLRAQTGQAVATAFKSLMQDDFKRPLADAVHGPIANLTHVAEQARGVMADTIKAMRFRTLTWLVSVFLLGVFTGAYGFQRLEQSSWIGMKSKRTEEHQATPQGANPPPAKAMPGRHGH